MSYHVDWDAAGEESIAVLRRLIQFDTTNPPGNERPAADYIRHLLGQEGINSEILEPAPGRANLVARLEGQGTASPLLLLCHTDVVYADPDEWTHPPFAAEVHDHQIWGRGALDMKHLATMELMTMLLIKRHEIPLERDLIFLAVADEEAMGHYGARWMLENHADKIAAEYVINEGGHGMRVNGRELYLVSTAEKGYGDLKLTTRGEAGHSALPRDENPVVALGRAITALGDFEPAYQLTPSAREMFRRFEAFLSMPAVTTEDDVAGAVGALAEAEPEHVARELAAIARFGAQGVFSPTMLDAGLKENVIPNQATANVNVRTVPGVTLEKLLETVRAVVGSAVEIAVKEYHPGTESPSDTPFFKAIEAEMAEVAPGSVVSPYVVPFTTDSRFFRERGIKAYGFAPFITPPELAQTIHGKDERIPLANVRLGTERLFNLVTRFCGGR